MEPAVRSTSSNTGEMTTTRRKAWHNPHMQSIEQLTPALHLKHPHQVQGQRETGTNRHSPIHRAPTTLESSQNENWSQKPMRLSWKWSPYYHMDWLNPKQVGAKWLHNRGIIYETQQLGHSLNGSEKRKLTFTDGFGGMSNHQREPHLS